MTEAVLWSERLRPVLDALGLDPVRVENVLGTGTPDVNYTDGWIELKDCPEGFPKRPGTVFTIPKLVERKEQVAWLMRRWEAGGACWLMIRVGREMFLFDGWSSREVRKGLTERDFRNMACWSSFADGSLPDQVKEDLRRWLEMDGEEMSPCQRARLYRLGARMSPAQAAASLGGGVVASDVVLAEQVHNMLTDDLLAYWEC